VFLLPINLCPPRNTVHVRRVDPSDLVLSLSSHRHSYIGLLLTLTLSILNKRSNRLIGKLTAFLQLQEFNLRNRPVDCSTSAVRRFPHSSSLKWSAPLSRLKFYVLTSTLTGHLLFHHHTLTHHIRKLFVSVVLTSSLSLDVPVPR